VTAAAAAARIEFLGARCRALASPQSCMLIKMLMFLQGGDVAPCRCQKRWVL